MNKYLLLYLVLITFALSIPSFDLIGQGTAQGLVVDKASKESLIGVNIIEKGITNGTASDAQGRFSLTASKNYPFTLEVSFLGYRKLEVLVTGPQDLSIALEPSTAVLGEYIVSARRRMETAQSVPIAISVIGGSYVEDAQAFNVNRIKELVPTVQLYSQNPRNTSLNIRGLGSPFGLTNDGLDPGVGFYVDGVYYARPAATTLDFIDIDQIEVLRGPQGTLFGKNTTSGAFNITTRKPEFTPSAMIETSYGNYNFVQARASVSGALNDQWAARISFSGTQRDGTIENIRKEQMLNDLNNVGVRGQLLFKPSDKLEVLFAGDFSRQRPDGYAQIVAGVTRTQRAEWRQFDNIISDLNYQLPTTNPFDRIVDHDGVWKSGQDFGGASINVDYKLGGGTLTSTTAWRFWDWMPSNDRDYLGLAVTTLSQAPSIHNQLSQELRYAGNISDKISGVIGVFAIGQDLKSNDFHREEAGPDAWRFVQNNQDPLWETPGLLDGYGLQTKNRLQSFSGAIFGQLDWAITERLKLLPGLRLNYDQKSVQLDRSPYGGLQTEDPALIALQRRVYNAQSFDVEVDETNLSGQLSIAYEFSDKVNSFATYSTNFKPVGVNLGGLPREDGRTMTELARVNPEYVTHFELGFKTSPSQSSTLNLIFHTTDIRDYQTVVQVPDPAVQRGYLANAEQVRVSGVELDFNIRLSNNFTLYTAVAYTDGRYISFPNAPIPLEETGSDVAFKDISGERLPGISEWAGSILGEYSFPGKFISSKGDYFWGVDTYFRSDFSSDASPSTVLNVEGYALVNSRLGFRASEGISVFVWTRNIFDNNYFEMLLPGGNGAGHYAGVLGDPRTYGITLRYAI